MHPAPIDKGKLTFHTIKSKYFISLCTHTVKLCAKTAKFQLCVKQKIVGLKTMNTKSIPQIR